MLGYYKVSTKQTTCGNCHVGHQSRWVQTKHALAHKTLKDLNTAPTATCWGCHTVNERGNKLTTAAGWSVKTDSAYQDVQCEACHGPGSAHVQNPEVRATWPLARLTMTVDGASCASCHSGTHHPFADEWKLSAHNKVSTTSTCATACHNGKTVLTAWGDDRELRGARFDRCGTDHLCRLPRSARFGQPCDAPVPERRCQPRQQPLHEVPHAAG
ncbi:MAG: hypothetical protein IPJ11_17230 [Gemmatimonadetes bacterium]|nr:hypothetical protein [Gemmatimonadota bacterium]